tara:strand:+ start:1217 stop:1318 length:102 start_codon:yes stop_codon:yes gene_type:complete
MVIIENESRCEMIIDYLKKRDFSGEMGLFQQGT